jgi:polysaccharide biosynthesis/export protein
MTKDFRFVTRSQSQRASVPSSRLGASQGIVQRPLRHLLPRRVAIVMALAAVFASVEMVSVGLSGGVRAANETGASYKLAPGDRLAVTVYGQAELSGDFVIDGDGEILLPVVGPVVVGELSAAQAQQAVFDRLSDGVLAKPTVSVRVSEYRPIMVVGDVKTPGSYAFRFGLSVKAAMAIAGGEGLPTDQRIGRMSEYLQTDERVRLLDNRRSMLAVRKARLEAQRADAAVFNQPKLVGVSLNDDKVETIYASEGYTFNELTQGHERQIAVLNAQRPRLEEQLKAVTEQLASERQRLKLGREQSADLAEYMKRGNLRRTVFNDQLREEARLEADVSRSVAEIARIHREIGEIDIRSLEIENAYKRQVTAELADTVQQLREAEVSFVAARDMLDLRVADRTDGYQGKSRQYKVTIIRTDGRETRTFRASDDTLLSPGDVLEVKNAPDDTLAEVRSN